MKAIQIILLSLIIITTPWSQAKTPLFESDVYPILRGKCFKCHAETKQKGRLRLDSEAWIKKGSENGPILEPFKPLESKLYTLTTYPEDDPDYMPSKGTGLTEEEKSLLKSWIENGAPFESNAFDTQSQSRSNKHTSQHNKIDTASTQYSSNPLLTNNYQEALDEETMGAIKILEDMNAVIRPDHYSNEKIRVDLSYSDQLNAIGSSKALMVLADKISVLTLKNATLDSRAFDMIRRFQHLEKLDLSQSQFAPKALNTLISLKHLHTINLSGSSASDEALPFLRSLPQLKIVYIWKSHIDERHLRTQLKNAAQIKIVSG